MLHRIIGRAGCGKTTYLLTVLREALENGADCVVLVPEQQSLETERLLSETLGDGYNMHCEVLNFERLPNRVAREYGDLARTFIDDSGRDLLLSVVLERLSPRLTEYGGVCADGDFIRKALSAIAAFKAAGVDADALDAAADRLRGSSARLAAKLSDLSLILRAYGDAFPEGLSDTYDALTQLAAELPDKPFLPGNLCSWTGSIISPVRSTRSWMCSPAERGDLHRLHGGRRGRQRHFFQEPGGGRAAGRPLTVRLPT